MSEHRPTNQHQLTFNVLTEKNPLPVTRALRRSAAVAAAIFSFNTASAGLSEEEFRDPPIQARPSALWTWLNGHVDLPQITRELEEMKAKGMRGAIIWDLGSIADPEEIIPQGSAFLGPESLAAIHHAMDEANRLGLELGMVASSSWNAGGTWVTPEQAGKDLRWSELSIEGPVEFSGILPLPQGKAGPFTEVAVLALPDHADKTLAGDTIPLRLDSHLEAGGRLTWSVPAGKWTILRFICRNTGHQLICPSPNSQGLMVDHLTKEAASAAHIYGKQLVNVESFTGWQHWQDGPATYKRLLDIALCAGLNQVTFHTFSHNPPGAGLPGFGYHAGEHFNVNSTWWD